MRRIVGFLLLAGASLSLLKLPAGVMDRIIDRASDGRLRLADTRGTLWAGEAALSAPDPQGALIRMRPVSWRVSFQHSPMLGLAIALGEGRQTQARIVLSPAGTDTTAQGLDWPIDLLARSIDHPIARIGWRGALRLDIPGLSCDWQGHCNGQAHLRWHNAALDIVPDRQFGDHQFDLLAKGADYTLSIHTLRGDFQIDGQGRFGFQTPFSFRATLAGDPEIVDRLPNILDRNARSSGPGRALITLP